ncbi:TrmH family RNA methyltransferase [Desulfothermobacter acidiphilus]|uniref:TrmH family RNA methyltransferase n=1 Tax=Desulfothermobacter acidiphilus TaxID=1938353 RepID=UPI003F8934F1
MLGRHHPRVKALQRLARKKGREEAGVFLVEGTHLVAEALRRGRVREVYCTPEWAASPEGEEILRVAAAAGVPRFGLPLAILSRAAATVTPQGVLAVVELPGVPWPSLLQTPNPFLVVVDGLQDPGNLGTVLRTAQAVAATGVLVLEGSVDPFHPRAVRASAGSVLELPLVRNLSPEEARSALLGAGVELVMADPRGESPFYTHSYLGPTAIIVGSEGTGPRPLWAGIARRLFIPMPGGTESLNVAVAAALFLYEGARQRFRWR